MLPPTKKSFSTRYTSFPILAKSIEALIPEIPAPITTTALVVSISIFSSALDNAARFIPALIKPAAFLVASKGLSECGQEHCSRIFT